MKFGRQVIVFAYLEQSKALRQTRGGNAKAYVFRRTTRYDSLILPGGDQRGLSTRGPVTLAGLAIAPRKVAFTIHTPQLLLAATEGT